MRKGRVSPNRKDDVFRQQVMNIVRERYADDDKVENEKVAKKLGIGAVIFESEEQIRNELNRRGHA